MTQQTDMQFNATLGEIDGMLRLPTELLEMFDASLSNLTKVVQHPLLSQQIANQRQLYSNISSDQLKKQFAALYNQACVLAVSALEIALISAFDEAFAQPEDLDKISSDKRGKIKITLEDLVVAHKSIDFGEPDGEFTWWDIGQLLRDADKSITMQDMLSIKRTFRDYLGEEPEIEEEVGYQIAFYLECRHTIVHGDAKTSKRFVKALTRLPTEYQERFPQGTKVLLDANDWQEIKASFSKLIGAVKSA